MLSSMENFTIKEQIGKGAQATVYIVEHQQDHEKFVLKKVECYDECEANKAFKEATLLQDLQHVYVSGYKEFFVLWEKEDSSVYICIVMDYFPQGTLQTVLNNARDKKEVIREDLIKQWMGQIIEGLVYIHKKNIIHRDVRPSNLYLRDDGNLVLGDFGVATIMGDAVTCTRACPKKNRRFFIPSRPKLGSLNYMAPEVIKKGYSESSDVFSLGCVLFELVTTCLYSKEEAIKQLQEVKENPEELDIIFDKICKHYSDSLITVLGIMLNTTKRPTALALLNNKFIRSCVEMSDATQVEKRKRLKSASTARTEIRPVPKSQGVLRVLEYLAHMIDYENCVRETLEYLLELAGSEDGLHLDPKGKKLVAMAMKNNLPDKEIQVYGCKVLSSLIMSADSDDVLFSPEVIAVIPLAMENHKLDPEVQLAAASLLMAMAANGMAGTVIGQLGGVHDILICLRTHPNNPQLCSTCLNAFWELTVHGNNVKIATEEKGIKDVCTVLKLHLSSAPVVEAACASILALSLDEENLELISELDGVGLLIDAITKHSKNPKVVKNACLALASLVEIDEESAYRVLTNEGPENSHIAGVPILVKTYELHKDNAEVVESIVTLLMELAEYGDICIDLYSYRIDLPIEEIIKKFHNNKDIMVPCEKALEKLLSVKRPVVPPTPSPDFTLKEGQVTPQVALQA